MGSNTLTSIDSMEKLRVLVIPFFATSHIRPMTELAICLAAANESVEATVAVTPVSVSIVQSLLDGRRHRVKIATYPFPAVDGLPKGVENLGTASTLEELLHVQVAANSESLTRPAQEALIRAQSPDAIVTDQLFLWNGGIADELGVPCVAFSVTGALTLLILRQLQDVCVSDDAVLELEAPLPRIRIPGTELPEYLRRHDYSFSDSIFSLQASCFGVAMNTSSELEKQYCEMHTQEGYAKRAYFIGPLALMPPPSSPAAAAATAASGESIGIMDWLDSKPDGSVVYISFGSLALIKDAQLDELALGLETALASAEREMSFLWVVRGKEEWSPPKGWEERVQPQQVLIVRAWAPQTAILAHRAVGAFLTHCGWTSILETVAAAVPVLTWPMAYDQFINERTVTEVLGIGQLLWPDGAGLRSETHQDHELVPARDVARALTTFMHPGGPGDMARSKAIDLAAKLRTAVAPGGSSHCDLHRLVDDLMVAVAAKKRTT